MVDARRRPDFEPLDQTAPTDSPPVEDFAYSPREWDGQSSERRRRAEPVRGTAPRPVFTTRSALSRRIGYVVAVALLIVTLVGAAFAVVGDQSADPGETPTTVVLAPASAEIESITFDDPTFAYDDFASTEGISLVGSAMGSEKTVSLTRKQEGLNQSGAAWYGEPVVVSEGFETIFAFQIDHVSWWTIGDGFAFVVQNFSPMTRGEGASGMGYEGIPKSIAVEFDTTYHSYRNDPRLPIAAEDPPDLLANHVSVNTRGPRPNTSDHNASLGHAGLPLLLFDRSPHVAVIRYVPGELAVLVSVGGELAPVLSVDVDLEQMLELTDGAAYVGFTAGTEPGIYADHRILGWVHGTPCLPEDCAG